MYQNHLRKHVGKKEYICTYCNKTSTQKSHRQHHTKTHTGEKTHVCPVCPNIFIEPDDVTEHIRAHSKDIHFNTGDPVSRGWLKDIKDINELKGKKLGLEPPPPPPAASSSSIAKTTPSSATTTPSSAKTTASSSLSTATPWRASATAMAYDRTTAEFSRNEEMSNYQNVDPKDERNDQEGFNNVHLKVRQDENESKKGELEKYVRAHDGQKFVTCHLCNKIIT